MDAFLDKVLMQELECVGLASKEDLRDAILKSGVRIKPSCVTCWRPNACTCNSFCIENGREYSHLQDLRSAIKVYRFFSNYRFRIYSHGEMVSGLLSYTMQEEKWKRRLDARFVTSLRYHLQTITDIDMMLLIELLSHIKTIKKNMGGQYVQDLLRLDISLCPNVIHQNINATVESLVGIYNVVNNGILPGKYQNCIRMRLLLEMVKYLCMALHLDGCTLSSNQRLVNVIHQKIEEIMSMQCATRLLHKETWDYCMIVLTLLP